MVQYPDGMGAGFAAAVYKQLQVEDRRNVDRQFAAGGQGARPGPDSIAVLAGIRAVLNNRVSSKVVLDMVKGIRGRIGTM